MQVYKQVYNKEVDVRFGQKRVNFNYSYNKGTKYQDLLDYVYSLFPDFNLCPCYGFARGYNYINSDTLIYKTDDINKTLNIQNIYNDYKCHCNNDNMKNVYRKTKREIIEKISELKNENNTLEKKIEKLEKEKNILQSAINGDLSAMDKLKKMGMEIKIKDENNMITINPENSQIIGNKEQPKIDFMNFYDVIIDIKSIKDINKGWEIKMSEKGEINYRKYNEDKIIKIGVIGNSNKGKSFLLSKISKINLPSGTSIRTEGLSVKYPELELFEDRKIALLDSAGLETPVLKSSDDNNSKLTVKDLFKEKSREKLITELFLQNYIINVSDILITVVGILTYSEQKLLNRIKTEIQRAKIKKPLFIIHNLITYTTVEQIEDYIKHYLLESSTFELEKGHGINTKTKPEKETGVYYFEKNSDPKIFHLIFANANSEAGLHYNQYTLDFLEKSFQSVTDLQPFDVIQTVKDRFIVLSKEILEFKDKENQITKDDFDNNGNSKMIKLNKKREITLKKCLIDELGFSNLKDNGFEPTYNYFAFDDNGQKLLKIVVESAGTTSLKSYLDYAGEYTFVKIKGKKEKDINYFPKNNIHNTREFGEFSLDIPWKNEDYLIRNTKPKILDENRLLIIQYFLDKKQEDEEYKVEDEV